jgi:hypothetical protein
MAVCCKIPVIFWKRQTMWIVKVSDCWGEGEMNRKSTENVFWGGGLWGF